MANQPYAEKLEPIARFVRFNNAIKFITKDKKVKLVDLGCGPTISFYEFACKQNIIFETYTAIDPLADNRINLDKKVVKILKQSIVKKIPLPNSSVDYVFASAIIEHVDFPEEILNECLRILKKGGTAILTTPTNRAKKILEFLSFKLNLISREGVLEHKQYFTSKSLTQLLENSPYHHSITHQYFEFGLNNLFVIKKL